MKRVIESQSAPEAVGAYSQATTNGELVFTAGQVPETMDGEVLNDATVEEQTAQCLENLKGVLEEEDLTLSDVLKTTVYIVDIQNWERVNKAYSEYFPEDPPSRSAIGVTGLWGGIDVEIQAIAAKD